MYQCSEINIKEYNNNHFYWMIVFKVCFKVFTNTWLRYFMFVEKVAQTYIQKYQNQAFLSSHL